jgi:hypothetical protein
LVWVLLQHMHFIISSNGIYKFHFIPDIRNILGDTVYPQGTIIIASHVGKSVSVEFLHDNHIILSTQIYRGNMLYDRENPAIYCIVITPEDEEPIKELLDLRGCVAMIVIQSPIKYKAEGYVAQCPRDLSSSSYGLEFGNTASFSNSFEFIK